MRVVNIFDNDTQISKETRALLKRKLEKSEFVVPKKYDPNAELVVCIGGDGSFLQTLHRFDFPDIPFVGINTGHLGFFQELHPEELDEFIFKYKHGKYSVQHLRTVKVTASFEDKKYEYRGLNEIIIKSRNSQTVHLNLSIGDSFIERFSGDGILVATPAGSTAYNYSLGGSIVDPRLNLLQVTPMAPMNTTAYRSFTSSIILPPDLSIKIYPEDTHGKGILILADGFEYMHCDIEEISIEFAEPMVKLIRLQNYDFWTKVKSKFL